jgi:hypothetical protein
MCTVWFRLDVIDDIDLGRGLFHSNRQWRYSPMATLISPIKGHWRNDMPIDEWSAMWFTTAQGTKLKIEVCSSLDNDIQYNISPR